MDNNVGSVKAENAAWINMCYHIRDNKQLNKDFQVKHAHIRSHSMLAS